MSSRKKKTDRRKKRKEKKQSRPANAIAPFPLPPGFDGVVVEPPGEARMSEVLMEFIEPYSDQWNTPDELTKLLGLATIAWNLGVLPPGAQREKAFQDALRLVPVEARPGMLAIVAGMLRRKESAFADNKRMIMNYRVTNTPHGFHLAVASTLEV